VFSKGPFLVACVLLYTYAQRDGTPRSENIPYDLLISCQGLNTEQKKNEISSILMSVHTVLKAMWKYDCEIQDYLK
jgi:hypothetical protein